MPRKPKQDKLTRLMIKRIKSKDFAKTPKRKKCSLLKGN